MKYLRLVGNTKYLQFVIIRVFTLRTSRSRITNTTGTIFKIVDDAPYLLQDVKLGQKLTFLLERLLLAQCSLLQNGGESFHPSWSQGL